jgi:DNA (cytosine-5)-methyltransferase 1
MMTFGSLFAGIGGFDLGLERAGMECRWQVEIDDYATSVLTKHWPEVTRWGDVRTFPVGDPADWRVDLICAGVPCQPVSHAGKQKGASDERWVWGEALRVVADLCPRFFVAENPIGLLNHDGGRTFHGILRAFASVGYLCEWHVISASAVGAPHRRERVWLVCFRNRIGGEADSSRSDSDCLGPHRARIDINREAQLRHQQVGVAGQMGADVADTNSRRRQRQRLPQHSDQQGSSGNIAYGCSSWGRWARPDQCRRQWATEPAVGRVAHGVPNRVDRLRCLGNAVVPQVAEVIGRAIMQSEGVTQ